MEKLIKELDEHLDVPVTAKIVSVRRFERSVAFAQMVEKVVAQIHSKKWQNKRTGGRGWRSISVNLYCSFFCSSKVQFPRLHQLFIHMNMFW